MIKKIKNSFIFVSDQNEACDFYTNKLGFKIKSDIPLGPDKRWLSVAPPDQDDFEIVLMKAQEGPFFDKEGAKLVNKLVASGLFGWCVFECEDVNQTYQELKSKGVSFKAPPVDSPAGKSAIFEDNSGNWFSLVENKNGS